MKLPLVRAGCDLEGMVSRLWHAASQAVEDDVYQAFASGSRTGSRPVGRASSQSEPQRRVLVPVEVVPVVVDVDVDLCGVAGNAEVEVCEMIGRALSAVVGPQVEVEGVLVAVGREELGAESRYVSKARKRRVCINAKADFRIHEAVDPVAQLLWEVAESERSRHCGGECSCGCGKTDSSVVINAVIEARALVRSEPQEAVMLVISAALSGCDDVVLTARALERSELEEAAMLVMSSAPS